MMPVDADYDRGLVMTHDLEMAAFFLQRSAKLVKVEPTRPRVTFVLKVTDSDDLTEWISEWQEGTATVKAVPFVRTVRTLRNQMHLELERAERLQARRGTPV